MKTIPENYAIYKAYYEPSYLDLYFIWNTETQLPVSIPMDLFTLVRYMQLMDLDHDLLIDNWESLKHYNTTIPNYKFRLSKRDERYLHKQAIMTNVISWAVKNRKEIEALEQSLDEDREYPHFKNYLQTLNLPLFHHLHFFTSLDYTYHKLLEYQKEVKEINEHLEIRNFMDRVLSKSYFPEEILDFFIRIYSDFNFPVEAIPHLIRCKTEFKESLEHFPYTLDGSQINSSSRANPILTYEVELFGLTKKDKLSILNDVQHLEDKQLSEFYQQRIESFSIMPLKDFDENLINKVFESLHLRTTYYVSLNHEETGILFPALYESVVDINKELVVFKRFGVPIYELYSKTGVFLESVHQKIHIYEQGFYILEGKSQSVLKHFNSEEGSKRCVFDNLEPKPYDLQATANNFIMDDILYNSHSYEQRFPNDAVKIKYASEGLFAICRDGKWGYTDWEYKDIIYPDFGFAGPFMDGYAKVLKLKPEYTEPKGTWVQLPTYVPVYKRHKQRHKYENRYFFPFSNVSHVVPFRLLEEETPTVDYADAYHFFGFIEEDVKGYGNWIIIDKDGDEVFEAPENSTLELLENGMVRLITENEKLVYDLRYEDMVVEENLYTPKPQTYEAEDLALKEKFNGISEEEFKEVFYTGYDDEHLPLGHPVHQLGDTVEDVTKVEKNGFDSALADDETYMRELVVKAGKHFKNSSDRLKDDMEFVLFAIQHADLELVYAQCSDRLRENLVFIKTLISMNPEAFKYLPKSVQENPEVFEFAFSKHPAVIFEMDPSYPIYTALVTEAVRREAQHFKALPEHLKSDRDLVIRLLDINPKVVNHLMTFHYTDWRIMRKAVEIDPGVDKYGILDGRF